jgi:hypothetical protein
MVDITIYQISTNINISASLSSNNLLVFILVDWLIIDWRTASSISAIFRRRANHVQYKKNPYTVRREGLAYRDNNFWLLLEEYEKFGKGGKTDFFCSAYNATTPMRNLQ